MNELIVFPTEQALRRFQQEQALQHGFCDASGLITFARLRKLCLPYTELKRKRMNEVQRLLLRNQAVEVAKGHFEGLGTLGALSDSALSDVLDQLIKELATLPDATGKMIDWMLDEAKSPKMRQLGTLFLVWRSLVKQEGVADELDRHKAILRLLRGPRDQWPPLFRDAKKITFRSVRWFNPFEESCIAALNHKLKLQIETALPPAHADETAQRLEQLIQGEIMTKAWAEWTENLSDAWAVNCPGLLQLDELNGIAFSRSSGDYGEIEDLARRIAWHLEYEGIAPNRIALIIPNTGRVQDIVPHVFERFKIPCYFRRGRPALSSPSVKAYLAWLAFPLRPERDALIDLVRNPALQIEDRETWVEQLNTRPPRLDTAHFEGLNLLEQTDAVSTRLGAQALKILKDRVVPPDDPFNQEALAAVEAVLERIDHQPLCLAELIDLLEELLENVTVKSRESTDQGVWVINPHDAAGLDFDLVLFAGLNEGDFPALSKQDALFSDLERAQLRTYLETHGKRLPALALAKADVLMEQQSVLFLTVLGMARHQLVLSCQAIDQEGNERVESEFFLKLWNLAGWSVQEEIQIGLYDQWRTEQTGESGLFARHLAQQHEKAPEDRTPMPGESFLTVVPLPLCRAQDEALQSAVSNGVPAISADATEPTEPDSIEHLVAMLDIEAERETYLAAPIEARSASKYCGHIEGMKERIAAWLDSKQALSPTALEKLAQCRYLFLLEIVLGIRDERNLDDTPDPMDRGSLIHSILAKIYRALADGTSGLEGQRLWAVRTEDGWRRRNEDGVGALPLAVLVPEREAEYVAFARCVAEQDLKEKNLGHAGVWAAEREKVLEQILNIVRFDARTCSEEHRYPALFEHRFGGDTAVELGGLRIKGTVDRVDLIFEETGVLQKVRVLDYKGASRARSSREDYLEEIRSNLDCQLPVYAMAAQHCFRGQSNTEAQNAQTEAGYLFYERKLQDLISKSKKSLLALDEPELMAPFIETLLKNLHCLKTCDFAVAPLVASYRDYESVCRVPAVENPAD